MTINRSSALALTLLLLIGCCPDPARAKVALTCDGNPIQVSLELFYRWEGGAKLGAMRRPELHLNSDPARCTLEDMYQRLLAEPGIVVRHSNGERVATAMIQLSGEEDWREVSDFNTVVLEEGMRVWMTMFNSPDNKMHLRKASNSLQLQRARQVCRL